MNVVGLYLSTSRYVLQANASDRDSWSDLHRYLPYLRQALSCCVCRGLLHQPVGPAHNVCQHFVCKACAGGKMKLKPACSWCKDRSQFRESTQMLILVQGFKTLCEYLYTSSLGPELLATTNGETNSLLLLIKEAIAFDDGYSDRLQGRLSALPSPGRKRTEQRVLTRTRTHQPTPEGGSSSFGDGGSSTAALNEHRAYTGRNDSQEGTDSSHRQATRRRHLSATDSHLSSENGTRPPFEPHPTTKRIKAADRRSGHWTRCCPHSKVSSHGQTCPCPSTHCKYRGTRNLRKSSAAELLLTDECDSKIGDQEPAKGLWSEG